MQLHSETGRLFCNNHARFVRRVAVVLSRPLKNLTGLQIVHIYCDSKPVWFYNKLAKFVHVLLQLALVDLGVFVLNDLIHLFLGQPER